VLELIWSELDRRLDHAITIHEQQRFTGPQRVVEVLGLLAVHVEPARHAVSCWSIEPDGTRRPIGTGWSLRDPFAERFWLRFAFQRWAPRLSRIDFVECPLNRPAEVEIETGKRLMGRLRVDRRYWQMADAFVSALGIPEGVFAHIERRDQRPTADRLTAVWWSWSTRNDP
jgi:hypothetical protein